MEEDDPLVALRDARSRFIAAFPAQCDSIEQLASDGAAGQDSPERANARSLVHRLVGLGGTIGFRTLSQKASELESLLLSGQPYIVQQVKDLCRELREAFSNDLSRPPDWAVERRVVAAGNSVLIIDDDPEQRAVIGGYLRNAGFAISELPSGEGALAQVRASRPSVVLLDVEMPGVNGYTVCRMLKADPDVAAIPVVILTTRDALDDRLTGLTLGADEFLRKPVDMRELLLRVQRLSARTPAHVDPLQQSDTLAYPDFVAAARGPLAMGPAAVALVRIPAAAKFAMEAFRHEIRRRDIVGRYNESHLVVLLPGMTAAAARDRLREMLRVLVEVGHTGLAAGIAGATSGATIEDLVAEADDALAEARVHGELAAVRSGRGRPAAAATERRLVLADDDPDVARIVDAHMRAEGFTTTVAFDGQQALDAVTRERPDVVILDLMMPKMTGFDVLHHLQGLTDKPRVIVLSARGREQDVTRAFDLGADDYMIKPFSPQELRARIGRLLR